MVGQSSHEYYLHEETLLSSNRAPPKEAAAAAAAAAKAACKRLHFSQKAIWLIIWLIQPAAGEIKDARSVFTPREPVEWAGGGFKKRKLS